MKNMVKRFQCLGCVNGSDPDTCHSVELSNLCCVNHCLGTSTGLNNQIALGLPTGFNKPGIDEYGKCKKFMKIRLFKKGINKIWDKCNVPVWALEKDGYLFVRTFSPRINMTFIDVVEGGTIDMVPNAIDVSTFINEIE